MGKNIIELNGKRYNALTGSLLGESATPRTDRPTGTPFGHRGRFIDGFVKTPKARPHGNAPKSVPFMPLQPVPEKAAAPEPRHHAAKHLPAHRPEHAKTLMRSAVSRPHISRKPHIKTQSPAEVMPKPAGTIVPKFSASHIDPKRLERSRDIKKVEDIKKFSPAERATVPVHARITTPLRGRPVSAPVTRVPIEAAPKPAVTAAKPKPDMFEAAIARATSHEQSRAEPVHKHRRNRRRLLNVVAGIVAVLIITGFVGYLNAPNIELRIASVRAGFHATLPGYQPVGYAMARSVGTHNNQITLSFRSDNGTGFKLTQQPSSWDSATLYDNLIAATNTTHQTIESSGRTIYLFGNTNAAWVNGGVLYQINGTAELSNDQVGQIAASM